MQGSAINTSSLRGLYPTASGSTIGTAGSSPSTNGRPRAATVGNTQPSEVDEAIAIGASANPLVTWGALFALLIALMWGSQKLGTGEDFRSIKLSAYNILTISLAAIIGLTFFKMVFTKFKVPGVSAVVLAA